jgi:hypothetical protein
MVCPHPHYRCQLLFRHIVVTSLDLLLQLAHLLVAIHFTFDFFLSDTTHNVDFINVICSPFLLIFTGVIHFIGAVSRGQDHKKWAR